MVNMDPVVMECTTNQHFLGNEGVKNPKFILYLLQPVFHICALNCSYYLDFLLDNCMNTTLIEMFLLAYFLVIMLAEGSKNVLRNCEPDKLIILST